MKTILFILLLSLALLAVAPAARANPADYPWHTNVVATTYWVGEIFNASAADGSQVCSTYDSQWAYHWSGIKTGKADSGTDCAGAPTGGCDGKATTNSNGTIKTCATVRYSPPDYWPIYQQPLENPYYLDLPYDDLNNTKAYHARCANIPWAKWYPSGWCPDPTFSFMKNAWVWLTSPSGASCYGQVEDAGPGQYNDVNYVFGWSDARPASKQYGNAGLDISPSLRDCLGIKELDGTSARVSWKFVGGDDVPMGAWKRVVTASRVTE